MLDLKRCCPDPEVAILALDPKRQQEFRKYFEYKSNEIIMIYYGIGLCEMDTILIDDGNDSLSVEEALSFVTLQRDFDENYCNDSASTACIILFCMGLGFRLIGFAQMLYQSHEQYFSVRSGCGSDGLGTVVRAPGPAQQACARHHGCRPGDRCCDVPCVSGSPHSCAARYPALRRQFLQERAR